MSPLSSASGKNVPESNEFSVNFYGSQHSTKEIEETTPVLSFEVRSTQPKPNGEPNYVLVPGGPKEPAAASVEKDAIEKSIPPPISPSEATNFRVVCRVCARSYQSRKRYEKHLEACNILSETKKLFNCFECWRQPNLKALIKHQQIHVHQPHRSELPLPMPVLEMIPTFPPPAKRVKRTAVEENQKQAALVEPKNQPVVAEAYKIPAAPEAPKVPSMNQPVQRTMIIYPELHARVRPAAPEAHKLSHPLMSHPQQQQQNMIKPAVAETHNHPSFSHPLQPTMDNRLQSTVGTVRKHLAMLESRNTPADVRATNGAFVAESLNHRNYHNMVDNNYSKQSATVNPREQPASVKPREQPAVEKPLKTPGEVDHSKLQAVVTLENRQAEVESRNQPAVVEARKPSIFHSIEMLAISDRKR